MGPASVGDPYRWMEGGVPFLVNPEVPARFHAFQEHYFETPPATARTPHRGAPEGIVLTCHQKIDCRKLIWNLIAFDEGCTPSRSGWNDFAAKQATKPS